MSKKLHEEYVKELSEISPTIVVIEEYMGARTKIAHQCTICKYEWMVAPTNTLKGVGCPVCAAVPKAIGIAPEYKNSIWTSEHREYFSQFLTEDQMKTNMPHSSKKVEATCPNCGKVKTVSTDTLFRNGLGCQCSDGVSYPNKFIYSLLNQLHVDYNSEYTPLWGEGRRYDIFCEEFNMIIENHGGQHYNISSFEKDRSLEDEIANDEFKRNIAIDNGVDNYIVLDCRHSKRDWIKQAIMNSSLPNILNFNENDINWNQCHAFALSNLTKSAADLWNNGLRIKEISKTLHISGSSVTKYLKNCVDLGWCSYTKSESIKRNGLSISGANHPQAKKVIRLIDGIIYETIADAAKDNQLSYSQMYRRCKKPKDFMYYNEYLEMKNNAA